MADSDPLGAVIALTSAAIELIGPPENIPWRFARSWLAASRFERHGRAIEDIDLALTDFDHLPGDLPGRAKLAAVLVVASVRAKLLADTTRLDNARRLTEIANADSTPLPDWPKSHAVVRSLILMNDAMTGAPGFELRAALAEVDRHAQTVGADEPYVSTVSAARLMLRHLLSQQDNDLGLAARLPDEVATVFSGLPAGSVPSGSVDLVQRLMALQSAGLRGDLPALMAGLDQLERDMAALPPGDPARQKFERAKASIAPLLAKIRIGGPSLGSADLMPLREVTELPGLSPTERALRLASLGVAETTDDASVDDAIAHLTEAVELAGPHDPRLTFYRMSLGLARIRRWEMTGSLEDLRAGTEALEQARADAGSPTHAYWTMASMPLAHAYRGSGRRQLGREIALSGLRGHTWNVLLQTSVADKHAAARHAAGDAIDVARWCLEDNDAESAAAALEAGRCLIMHSAIETRDVDTRLRALGEDRLAQRWRQAVATSGPNDAPADLRRQVIAALSGLKQGDGTTRLLDPPSPHEMRAALTALGADALVYLMPGETGHGAAVVVPAGDRPSWLLLPGLNSGSLQRFRHILGDGMTRDARRRTVRADLPEVCRWAWDVAIGPLLTEHLQLPEHRPVRLVLVPMGELARVPWHAAYRGEYALRQAVFSYTPSARLLCEAAWGEDVALSEHGLVVGDPDTGGAAPDLPAARAEALAIRDAFYPKARYVGRDALGRTAEDGAGDRSALLAWLADPDGGPLAHLACHGVVRGGEDQTSYLLLANNERLAAEELVDAPRRGIGLAVLAACRSAESGRGYDEAFSLATAFLANGTRSVVSAQWSVPDAPTSVLMFLFHHYLREHALRPVDALREAQLWMIGDEPPPERLPAELRAHLEGARDLSAWAGFIHFGR